MIQRRQTLYLLMVELQLNKFISAGIFPALFVHLVIVLVL